MLIQRALIELLCLATGRGAARRRRDLRATRGDKRRRKNAII